MAESTLQNVWESPIVFPTLTDLHSLADGNIWNSGAIADASPTRRGVEISFNLVGVTPGAGDAIQFWVIGADGDGATPYWPGSISAAQGEISTAAAIAEALSAIGNPHHQVAWRTSHGTTFRGTFLYFFHRPDWQLLVRSVGMALAASGNVARYRYMTDQTVAV